MGKGEWRKAFFILESAGCGEDDDGYKRSTRASFFLVEFIRYLFSVTITTCCYNKYMCVSCDLGRTEKRHARLPMHKINNPKCKRQFKTRHSDVCVLIVLLTSALRSS